MSYKRSIIYYFFNFTFMHFKLKNSAKIIMGIFEGVGTNNMTLMKHWRIKLKLQICCKFSQFKVRIKCSLLRGEVYFNLI
jgi:hypothetical protein